MKKTNKPSFAVRAKDIIRKYPRAKFDKAEKEAMEQELDALIEEQEAMKQAMGLDVPAEQQVQLDANQAMMEGQMEEPMMFAGGGQFDPLGRSYRYPSELSFLSGQNNNTISSMWNASVAKPSGRGVLTPVVNKIPMLDTNIITPEAFPTVDPNEMRLYQPNDITKPMKSIHDIYTKKNEQLHSKAGMKQLGSIEMGKLKKRIESGGKDKSTNQFLPSYIAAGTNIAGNLLQMALDKKPKNINFARYAPEDIDLSEQRMALQTDADLSRSVGRNTARNLGMNAGQAMSNIVASESDVSRNLANSLMQSRLTEETTNVGERNRAGQINAEIGMKESLLNREMQEAQKDRTRGYLAGAMQTIPDAMKDINQIKYQMEYLKMMGMSEENALKWLSQKYPNYMLQVEDAIASKALFKQPKG